jgi:coenzyme F420 hydrogenase subunit delta
MYETLLQKHTLVFGCGNPLFGDDGFGPEIIACLEEDYVLPDYCLCLDAGTSVRDILFDILLSPKRPCRILIIDAVQIENRAPGDIFEIDVAAIPDNKTSDFSLHQFPTTNMLKELKEMTGIEVRVLVVQTGPVPDRVSPGLTPAVTAAVPHMCRKILSLINDTAVPRHTVQANR